MAAQKPSQPLIITEAAIRFTKPLKVDRDQGIIYGVKVLGWESDNDREYARPAAERAVANGLYENKKTYADHAAPGNTQARSVYDLTGKLYAAQVREDGVYANWRLNKAHTLYEAIISDAEAGTGFYGLSHAARAGDYEIRNGKQVVLEIAEVYSVDLVSDPATNVSLSESKKGTVIKKIKLVELFESLTTSTKLTRPKRLKLLSLLEDKKVLQEMGDYAVEEPAADVAPEDQLKAGFSSAIMGHVEKALAGEADPKEALALIKDLLMGHHKLNGGETVTEDDDKPGEGDGKKDDDEKPKEGKNGKPAPPATQLTEARIKDLCDLAGVELTDDVKEAALGCTTEAAAVKVIKLAKGKAGAAQASAPDLLERSAGSKPIFARSAPAGTIQEARNAGAAAGNAKTNLQEAADPDKARAQRVARLRGTAPLAN